MTVISENLLREMARMANKHCLRMIAEQLRKAAPLSRDVNGEEALLAFARAMDSTTDKVSERSTEQ